MTIEEALSKFVVQLRADGRSAPTISQYERHIGLLRGWLRAERGTDELDGLDHETVAAFLTSSAARLTRERVVKRPNTVNALRTSLRCFFAFAHAAGWLSSNPARLVRRALCSPGPPRAMSDGETEKLLATLKNVTSPEAQRDLMLIELMLHVGLRIGSTIALDVEDVDLDRGELRLRRMKGSREETAILGDRTRDHLRAFLASRTSGPLFTGRHGRRISRRHVQRRLGQWLAEAGISNHFSPHSLRKSFGCRLYGKTRDLLLVQQALHHRSITSTLVYARLEAQDLRRALS